MISNLKYNKILWILVSFLTLTAALTGVFNTGIYSKVVGQDVITGVISQDLTSIVAAIIVLVFSVLIKERDIKKQIVVIGILGYLFYAYGIYVIEQFYNSFYFIYMAVFALSFYAIVYGVANIRSEIKEKVELPRLTRYVSVGFSLFIPLLFYPLWISQLLPLIQEGRRIESMLSLIHI